MDEINLGSVEKIPLGQGHCFVVGTQEIAVFRPRAGEMFAVSNRCPHRQAPLADGVIDTCHVICPYHGHKFDLRSGAGEGNEKIKTYQVTVKDGEILLTL